MGGGWPMRGRDLIMWSEGQWEASKKDTWKGDRYTDKLTLQLYERIGQGPILWKSAHTDLSNGMWVSILEGLKHLNTVLMAKVSWSTGDFKTPFSPKKTNTFHSLFQPSTIVWLLNVPGLQDCVIPVTDGFEFGNMGSWCGHGDSISHGARYTQSLVPVISIVTVTIVTFAIIVIIELERKSSKILNNLFHIAWLIQKLLRWNWLAWFPGVDFQRGRINKGEVCYH